MTEQEYKVWSAGHARLFGFRDDDLAMLAAWYDVLGIHPIEDLREATRRLAAGEHPDWPRQHLQALTRQIASLRAERVKDSLGDVGGYDRGSCVQCGASGRVLVPHPRSVIAGKWEPLALTRSGTAVYYECAVYCYCPTGLWFAQHSGGGLTLAQYEQRNPRWRTQLALRRGEDQAILRLSLDPRRHGILDQTLQRLASKFGMNGGNDGD